MKATCGKMMVKESKKSKKADKDEKMENEIPENLTQYHPTCDNSSKVVPGQAPNFRQLMVSCHE